MSLYLRTLRALLAPRRAVPIAVVVVAMLFAQGRAGLAGSVAELGSMVPAGAMAATFVLLGPFAWRALFPADRPVRHRVLRLEDIDTSGWMGCLEGGAKVAVSRSVARRLRRRWGL